jgi:hypothetical protein
VTRGRDRWRPSLADARLLAEVVAIVFLTWLALGWRFEAIARGDGDTMWQPYLASSLAAGSDWTHHLYRFGWLGGSAMHDAAGTLPLVSACAALGLGPVATSIVQTMFVQSAFAFMALVGVRGFARALAGTNVALSWPLRVATIWATAFAPWLGWRLGMGHDNLVLGLIPFFACAMLAMAARGEVPSPVALVVASVLVWHGFATVGAQMVVYSAYFGAPVLLAILLVGAERPRWSFAHLAIALSLVAGVFLVLPRFAGMLHYAAGSDFPRAPNLVYSYTNAATSPRDWLQSISWAFQGRDHETNLPLGPLVFVAIACWPKGTSRATLIALGISLIAAVLFASDVPPFSLFASLPGLATFRVPARAVLVGLSLVAPLAIAAFAARGAAQPAESSSRAEVVAITLGLVVLVVGLRVPVALRETLAWLFVIVAIAARGRVAVGAAALVIATAFGAVAFVDRIPDAPHVPIDGAPREIHDHLVAQTPALADPFNRVQIIDAPPPYAMSTAMAAGLSSLDGVWWPTRRYLALIAALRNRHVPSTTMVFALSRDPAFPVLAQLYNVRSVATESDASHVAVPSRLGAAWMPQTIARVLTTADVGMAFRTTSPARVGWVLGMEAPALPSTCTGRVISVEPDALGQSAAITVEAETDCVVVVATNYVEALHATSGGAELPVFPVDIALTGILVPPGTHTITLGPQPYAPLWARAGTWLGLIALATALWLASRAARAVQ